MRKKIHLGWFAALLLMASSASAQKTGYLPPPASQAPRSAAWQWNQAVGQTLELEHAADRARKWWVANGDLGKALRDEAVDAERYDSSAAWTGKNCVTPVRNQGQCQSCWAFASVAAMESSYCIENDVEAMDGAEQTMLECRQGVDTLERCGKGNHMAEPFDILRSMGVDQEARSAYRPGTYTGCKGPGLSQTFYGIDGAVYVQPNPLTGRASVEDIKRAIVDHGAVTAVLAVTRNRFQLYRAGTPIMTTADDLDETITPNNNAGGHVVILTGWDDTLGAWRLKNSWGPRWSNDGGFAWIVYDDLSMHTLHHAHVTPMNKRYNWAQATAAFAQITARVIFNPQIWTENPYVHFPRALGFPASKARVVDGYKWAFNQGMLDRSILNTWPSFARARFE